MTSCPCIHMCLRSNTQYFFRFLRTVTVEEYRFHHIQFHHDIHHLLRSSCTRRVVKVVIDSTASCFQKLFQSRHLFIGHPAIPVFQVVLLYFRIGHFRNVTRTICCSIDRLVMANHYHSVTCHMSIALDHFSS